MSDKIAKKSEIKLTVSLDENKVPASIEWKADDSGMEGSKPCESFMLSVWDAKEQASLRIDLWTKNMSVEDMKGFFYETFMGMAETYNRATNEKEIADEIKAFAQKFAVLNKLK